jgi:hypothetical protein
MAADTYLDPSLSWLRYTPVRNQAKNSTGSLGGTEYAILGENATVLWRWLRD